MRWLYRLQARFGLAAPEGTAALVLLVALAAGTVARHVQASSSPVAPDLYAASDADFEASSAEVADVGALGTPGALSVAGPPEAPPHRADPVEEPRPSQPAAEARPPARHAPARASGPARTRVNSASAADLERLPGIGPALAARVVAHREQHGRFPSADRLADVKGIGPKTVEKMRPWVVID